MMNLMRSGGNPQGMVQNMLMQDPNYSSVMNLVKQYNGDAKTAFYEECKKKGVDPNSILGMMQ